MTDQGMRADDPMRHSGAVWCDDHGRWECHRNSKRSGDRCHGAAISGTSTCRMHAGKASSMAKAQGELNRAAWSLQAASELQPLDTADLVMAAIRLTRQRVELLGELIRVQVEDQDYEGLVGSTYAAGRDGARVETGERMRALVAWEGTERDRLVRFAKTADDMGIARQHVELEQAKAAIVVGAMRAAMDAAGSSLLPAVRDVMLRAFLAGLGQAPAELEAGAGR